jgi:isocitrate dehydrogenase
LPKIQNNSPKSGIFFKTNPKIPFVGGDGGGYEIADAFLAANSRITFY